MHPMRWHPCKLRWHPRNHPIGDFRLPAGQLLTLFLAVTISLSAMHFSARASERGPGQAFVKADEEEVASVELASGDRDDTLGDYRLAPGDRVTIAVFDERQLSGDFFIDGGGEVLLPVAGSVKISGLTLIEAQEVIRKKFADGVLAQPAVNVRIEEYRPIFVTGQVKKAGRYPYMLGETVKAAIATAGGEGQAIEQPLAVAMSDFVTAEERVRQLEVDRVALLIRKARLEAQRDARADFMVPLPVGLNASNVDFERVYTAENDTFSRLEESYRLQRETLERQRPRVEEEVRAVTEQIKNQNERLEIVDRRLADLEPLFQHGNLRKEVLTNQQIEKTLVHSQLSNLEAQVARLRQTKGDIEVKLSDVKANYLRQVLGELQDTTQRLRVIDATLGYARKVRDVKAEAASGVTDGTEYVISISRRERGRMINFDASDDTPLLPGDVVEVKREPHVSESIELPSTEAAGDLPLNPASYLAEGKASSSR